jgi:hypothetical protein
VHGYPSQTRQDLVTAGEWRPTVLGWYFPNAPEASVNSSAFLGSPEARKRGYQAPAWLEADVQMLGSDS